MNLRQIEVFHAVMTNGTASRAAEVLRISQPAVSKAIQELERGTGLALFHRINGRLVPTSEAQLFFREVEQSFTGLIHLRSAAARIRDFGSGEIRLASLSALSTNVVPKALYAFQKRHPEVAITFQARMSSMVKDLVSSGQFDIGLAADEIDLAGVDAQPFANYRTAIALPANHHLTERTVICPQDLHGEAFIALAPEDTTRRQIDAIFEAEAVKPKIVLETPYSTTICAMVNAGLGCGVVNPITAEPFLGKNIVIRPFERAVYFRTLLLLPPNGRPSKIVRDLMSELKKHASADDGTAAPTARSSGAAAIEFR
ncbi:LysR substrate-binding domain-containing protein [Sinorhizobium terangae]|uniref:LysR family transcriptional regulator n=1 Tax=Sinorhizobium terangae TaxID=110322 RepID=A0A6N7LG72_SINTE|nr:LysR substrate-binding domain-containing protein [Sinorhizobium terangae]MBB4184722.1 DNA-binding transcriptional LysR family regulator [Sinorhizobium terangae]MQX16772.1 LysR family transcriptional regulator [Sinorhizobium terangae]WFU50648.1 LysR substrate-binding domain-containing protein [Sinorhizobium terangae]